MIKGRLLKNKFVFILFKGDPLICIFNNYRTFINNVNKLISADTPINKIGLKTF